MFGPTAFGVRMPFEAVPPGCRVVLAFRNRSNAAASVNGCFMGNVVKLGEVPPPEPQWRESGFFMVSDDDDGEADDGEAWP